MNRVKLHQGNFERCRKLLSGFANNNLSMKDIHSFVGWADRNTVRMQCNFNPLQQVMKSFETKLITDPFIADKPLMIAKTSSIFFNLNYFSTPWMEYATNLLEKWIKKDAFVNLQQVLPHYRLFVQFGWRDHHDTLDLIRLKVIELLSQEIVTNREEKLSQFIERIHRQLKILLIDPDLQTEKLLPLLQNIQNIFVKNKIDLDEDYYYVHSAMVSELFNMLGIQPKNPAYLQFLRKAYKRYQGTIAKGRHLENVSPQFSRKGESVFEIRFQRNLSENGFWYERNKIIGLHQFDILLKGRLYRNYFPLGRLSAKKNIEQIDFISEQELNEYKEMKNLWNLEKKELWKDPLLINLNGPFHQMYGDRSGSFRSEEIKKNIAEKQGFKDLKIIHFKEWEVNTPNKRAITEYFNVLVGGR